MFAISICHFRLSASGERFINDESLSMTQPINPRRREKPAEKVRWQSSAKWTLVASIGVTVGMFAVFYFLFLRG